MLSPKLPLVSNWRILRPSARLSHILILPSKEVAARYCPSSERAIDHISPAILASAQISVLYPLPMRQLWSRGNRTHNLGPFTPSPIISCCPDFDLATKTHASGYLSIPACGGMVAAKFVGIVESLKKGIIWLVGRVDFDGRRSGRGENLTRCST